LILIATDPHAADGPSKIYQIRQIMQIMHYSELYVVDRTQLRFPRARICDARIETRLRVAVLEGTILIIENEYMYTCTPHDSERDQMPVFLSRSYRTDDEGDIACFFDLRILEDENN